MHLRLCVRSLRMLEFNSVHSFHSLNQMKHENEDTTQRLTPHLMQRTKRANLILRFLSLLYLWAPNLHANAIAHPPQLFFAQKFLTDHIWDGGARGLGASGGGQEGIGQVCWKIPNMLTTPKPLDQPQRKSPEPSTLTLRPL